MGDSVATIVNKDGSWQKVSVDHNVLREDEHKRILESGGHILRNKVAGSLEVTRAFGNLELKSFIVSDPEGVTIPLQDHNDLLILSTDGLYRSYSAE